MKVLHFAQWTPSPHCGVTQKIVEQCAGWTSQGASVASIMLCVSGAPSDVQLPEFVTVIAPESTPGTSLVGRYIAKVRLLRRVREVVRQFGPDVTYARRFTWAPGYLGAIAPGKLVLEVNTNDRAESGEYPLAKRVIYRLGLSLLSRRADGFVTVTPDLAVPLRKTGKSVETIGNAISPSRFPADIAASCRQSRSVVFVGTPGQSWHGLDRLIELAKACPDISFHVAGPSATPGAPNNVFFHGLLGRAGLADLYGRCAVGIGSLALERVAMTHSSSLKVREYLACGLSVLLESEDEDVSSLHGVEVVPWGENWVQRAKDSLERLINVEDRQRIREAALIRCGSDAVEGRRLSFFREVVGEIG